MEEEETSDFPIILYKKSSCSFVKGSVFEVDVELGVLIDSALIVSH